MSRDLNFSCSRYKNRTKVLVYDESGMWVLAKRLDPGTFARPALDDIAVRIEYREEQLALRLSGFDSDEIRAPLEEHANRETTLGAFAREDELRVWSLSRPCRKLRGQTV